MRIFVTAKPRAREAGVEVIDAASFVISVTEPPVQGQANKAIARALADHLHVSPSSVRLVSGFSSRLKVFDVAEAHKLG